MNNEADSLKYKWLKKETFHDGEWIITIYMMIGDKLNIYLTHEKKRRGHQTLFTRYRMQTNVDDQGYYLKIDTFREAKKEAIRQLGKILKQYNEDFRNMELAQ